MTTPGQLEALLGQVIRAEVRAELAARDARVAAKTLAAVQRQLEVAIVRASAAESGPPG